MKAAIVFLIGVAVGWMLLPRLEPEYAVELEPIEPEPARPGIATWQMPWLYIGNDGTVTWTRPN